MNALYPTSGREGWERSCSAGFLMVSLLWTTELPAQSDAEFEEWLKKDQQAFQEFKDERDREFLEFLQKEWQAFQALGGVVQDETPKPRQMPVVEAQIPPPAPPVESKIAEEVPLPPAPSVVEPERRPLPVPIQGERTVRFGFFGDSLAVNGDQSLEVELGRPLDQQQLSAFWEGLSRSHFEGCLEQAQQHREQLGLNDWGYCQLLGRIGEGLYAGDLDRSRLFAWFMLVKSGYAAQVGYDAERVYLLLPAAQVLYGVSYLTLGGQKYYAVSFEGKPESIGSVFTYEGRYPGAEQVIDFTLMETPRLGGGTQEKVKGFRYGEGEFQVPVKLDHRALDFLGHYPQTEYEIYFGASPSVEAGRSLLAGLQPLVKGRTEAEAVDLLLCFVQLGFGYQVDEEQFGRERSLFPEETLFYPSSDCEDRSILFAYLVRELLGLEVIGLDYPGHIATAVKFSSEVPGDYVVFGDKKYTICDPTYLNARVGMGMPRFKGVDPRVILVRG